MGDKYMIIYSSQTGNAEDIAFKIHSELCKLRMYFDIHSSDNVEISTLPHHKIVIFIISTTGDGDMPDSMTTLWKFLLRKSLAKDSLSSLKVAIFGLGDSSYEKYNSAARKLYSRFHQLGANDLVPLGLGDDQAKYGYLTAFYPWWRQLLVELQKEPRHSNATPMPDISYHIDIQTSPTTPQAIDRKSLYSSLYSLPQAKTAPVDSDHKNGLLTATVAENMRLTSSDWFQDVRNLKFIIDDRSSSPPYDVSDIAVVFPICPAILVTRAIRTMAHGFQPDTRIIIRQTAPYTRPSRMSSLSSAISIIDLFTYVVDVSGIPQRSYFEGIAAYATYDEEKEKLIELSSAEGMNVYYDYVVKEKRNYVEVLEDFRSCRPPLHKLLELIPMIQPRQYSIASYAHWKLLSSSSSTPSGYIFDLCIGRMETKTRYGRMKFGLCSNYLCDLEAGDKIYFYIKKGLFAPPAWNKPLILIGPGTGVAPMRALLQRHIMQSYATQPHHHMTSLNPIEDMSSCILFFGCRKKINDYLYHREWDVLFDTMNSTSDPTLLSLRTAQHTVELDTTDIQQTCNGLQSDHQGQINISVAFSRDNEESLSKEYVIHKMILHGQHLWKLIHEQDAYIFISGSSTSMPRDVRQSWLKIIQEYGSLSSSDADAYLIRLQKNKRYIVEAWS